MSDKFSHLPSAPGRSRPSDAIVRAAVASLKALALDGKYGRATEFTDDASAKLILRAAVDPATTTGSGWASTLAATAVADFVGGLTLASAGAALAARGVRVDMTGVGALLLPNRITAVADAGSWIAEAGAIPVRSLPVAAGPTLTPKKLSVICSFTRETAEATGIEALVRQQLTDGAALAFDVALFGTDDGTGNQPAGILNSVAPSATSAASGQAALIEDVSTLVAALATSGGGRDPVFIAAPATATRFRLWAPPLFVYPILSSAAVTEKTLVAVEGSSLVSGFSPVPEITSSIEATLHMDDAPSAISSTATLGDVAYPVRSLWQTDSIALRMILRGAWAMRATGHVAYVANVVW